MVSQNPHKGNMLRINNDFHTHVFYMCFKYFALIKKAKHPVPGEPVVCMISKSDSHAFSSAGDISTKKLRVTVRKAAERFACLVPELVAAINFIPRCQGCPTSAGHA